MKLLLNPNPANAGGEGGGGGGGQGAGSGAGGAGGSPTTAAPSTSSTQSTAQKLWGVDNTPPKTGSDSGSPSAGAGQPGGEAKAGAGTTQSGTPAPATQPQGGQGQPAAGGEPQPPRIELTEELLGQLGERIAKSVKGPEPEKTLSAEEFNKMFNIYQPSEELLAAVLGQDKQVALQALTQMLHGASKQATTIASHLIRHELAAIQQAMAPAIQMAEERQLEAMKVEFFEKNPDLKGLDPLLVLIRDQFVAQGKKFPTKEAAFKAVAEEARKHMESIPGLKTAAANAAQNGGGQGANQPANRMPALSGGKGQAGAGDAGAASGSGAKKSTAERIFGS